MTDLFTIALPHLDGTPGSLADFRGKVLLLVNVASECGFTPQYKGLQALHEKYATDGLVVIGVPSNDFGGQEPGSAEEIQSFCETKYGVTFPLTQKVKIKGDEAHPLYSTLQQEAGKVDWNFNKFLIGRDGSIKHHFPSSTAPDSAELSAAIEQALGEK